MTTEEENIDIEELIKSTWNNSSNIDESDFPGLSMTSIIEISDEQCLNNIPLSVKNLILIYNEVSAWFINLAMLLVNLVMNDKKPIHPSIVNLMCMSGLISSQIIAIHRLITFGLDVQSKQLLRVLTEQVDVAIALSIKPELSSKFSLTLDENTANSFWHQNISRGKLRKDILKYLEISMGPESARKMILYIKQEEAILGMGIHPSLAAAQMACLPATGKSDEPFSFGFLGKPTVYSERTIKYSIFYLVLYVAIGFVPDRIDIDNANPAMKLIGPLQDHVLHGRSVILKLAAKLFENQYHNNFNTKLDKIKSEFGL